MSNRKNSAEQTEQNNLATEVAEEAEKETAAKETAAQEEAAQEEAEKETAKKETAAQEEAAQEEAEKETAKKETAKKETAEKETAEKETAKKENTKKKTAEKEKDKATIQPVAGINAPSTDAPIFIPSKDENGNIIFKPLSEKEADIIADDNEMLEQLQAGNARLLVTDEHIANSLIPSRIRGRIQQALNVDYSAKRLAVERAAKLNHTVTLNKESYQARFLNHYQDDPKQQTANARSLSLANALLVTPNAKKLLTSNNDLDLPTRPENALTIHKIAEINNIPQKKREETFNILKEKLQNGDAILLIENRGQLAELPENMQTFLNNVITFNKNNKKLSFSNLKKQITESRAAIERQKTDLDGALANNDKASKLMDLIDSRRHELVKLREKMPKDKQSKQAQQIQNKRKEVNQELKKLKEDLKQKHPEISQQWQDLEKMEHKLAHYERDCALFTAQSSIVAPPELTIMPPSKAEIKKQLKQQHRQQRQKKQQQPTAPTATQQAQPTPPASPQEQTTPPASPQEQTTPPASPQEQTTPPAAPTATQAQIMGQILQMLENVTKCNNNAVAAAKQVLEQLKNPEIAAMSKGAHNRRQGPSK